MLSGVVKKTAGEKQMGRLPSEWAGRVILDRIPYTLSGELALASAVAATQFAENTFSNNTDKPFEIHRMIPRQYALDSQNVLLATQPDQDMLAGLTRLDINDLGVNQIITKNPTLIGLLTKGSSERDWEFADPHYLTRGNQIQITASPLTYPSIEGLSKIRTGVAFQGFLLVVAAPSENR
jgi:hypothetical protein